MEKLDVVYFVKPDQVNNELLFSLRTVERNFPHARVWFCGGQPIELTPDERMSMVQQGANRYEKVRNMLIEVCRNNEITEDFWLFNDDFFILRPIDDLPPWYNGTLREHVANVEHRNNGMPSKYTRQLRRTINILLDAGCDILNYAVHAPMRVNREKMLKTIERFPDCPMFRALYGNYNEIGGIDRSDCKIVRPEIPIPADARFVSTSDASFINGLVGRQIRERFTEPSRWEVSAE